MSRKQLADNARMLDELEYLEANMVEFDSAKHVSMTLTFDNKSTNTLIANSREDHGTIHAVKSGLLARMDELRKALYRNGVDINV
jgi:hypothetical protein